MSENQPPSEPNSLDEEPAEAERSAWSLVAQFFVIPLGVVVLAVSVFLAFGLVTRERRSAS